MAGIKSDRSMKETKIIKRGISVTDINIGFLTALLCNGMLFLSVRQIFDNFYMKNQRKPLEVDIINYSAGFLICFFFIMILLSVMKKKEWVIIAAAVVTLIVSVINYYEYRFRGTVFTYEDFNNAGTAVRVLKQYDLMPSADMVGIILFFLLLTGVSFFCAGYEKKHDLGGVSIRRFFGWTGLMLAFFVSFFVVDSVMKKTDPWSWEELYATEGYVSGTIHFVLANLHSPVKKPDGYDEWNIRDDIFDVPAVIGSENTDYPDIILILNETWYDLGHFLTLDTDEDYMSHYRQLEAVKGYAVVPIAGGGTNNSEYELLTSDSMTLMNTYAPFLSLKPNGDTAVTGYLRKLGYSLLAAHSEQGTNYKRNQVWPAFGFDEIHFGEDFSDLEYYGKRERATDSSAFHNVQNFYRNMPEESPRFVFWLTIQNHGGWNINPPENDIIHLNGKLKPENVNLSEAEKYTGNDDLENVINEYLSSVSLTDQFIGELTDYFREVYQNEGRKVIVCMVGDHAPDFIRCLNPAAGTSEGGKLQNREVPYFIWNNYEDVVVREEKNFDLCCLMPFMLREANLPLTDYYESVCEIGEKTHCFTRVPAKEDDITYMDQNDMICSIYDGSELSEKVKQYFYQEYSRIKDS